MSALNRSVVALLLMGFACAVAAGELRLNNGAILPGELSSVTAKSVVWNADKIGKITVSKADITSLATSHTVTVKMSPEQASRNDCTVSVKDLVWSLACAAQPPYAVAFTDLRSVAPATSANGKISTALEIDRGASPSEQLNVDLAARWLRPTHRHKIDASVDYEKSDGTTTDDEADANYQYDLLRDDGWYWYGRVKYYRDKFEALQEVYAAGVGIGRDFTPVDDLTLSVQGGPMEMYYFYNDEDGELEPGGNMHWNADWQTPWYGIVASHSGDLGWVFSIDNGYLFQTKTGVTFPLYAGLVGEVRLDYDRTGLSAINGSKYDLEWVFGLGYKW